MLKKKILSILIIILGIGIAGGIFFSKEEYEVVKPNGSDEARVNIRPYSTQDHILGNPNAEIIIIEYADFECPYCKEFHTTMEKIIEDFGKSGKVAWVYRHFQLEEENSKSRLASESSECVAEILGEEYFWKYISEVFSKSPDSLSENNLKQIAENFGIDSKEYDLCLNSGKHTKKIENDIYDGLLIYEHDPNFGTPYSIVISKNGYQTQIIGSQPYSVIKEIINSF